MSAPGPRKKPSASRRFRPVSEVFLPCRRVDRDSPWTWPCERRQKLRARFGLRLLPVMVGFAVMVLTVQTPFTSTAFAKDVVPFKIQVPDAVLEDLKHRLEQARFADEIPDANWDY